MKNIDDGPYHLQLLERPVKTEQTKHDVTLIVNTPLEGNKMHHSLTCPIDDQSAGGKNMHQTVVHYDPTAGHVTKSGQYRSPMLTLYHELIHSCQYRLVSAGQLTIDELDQPDRECSSVREKLAVIEENKLAKYLGQGIRENYTEIAPYRVANFASPTPEDEEVVSLIQNYREGRIEWPPLQYELFRKDRATWSDEQMRLFHEALRLHPAGVLGYQ